MKRWFASIMWVVLVPAASAFAGSSETQIQATIDATRGIPSARRGMGPFPNSELSHKPSAFPVRLDLLIPSGQLRQDDTSLFDFVLTNVSSHSIRLPVSVDARSKHTHMLTLYMTSTDGHLRGDIPPCAELFGQADNPATFMHLLPGRSVVVHASSRFVVPIGHLSLVGHAEYLLLSNGTSTVIGSTDSNEVDKKFFRAEK
jgi:hypothetical protein